MCVGRFILPLIGPLIRVVLTAFVTTGAEFPAGEATTTSATDAEFLDGVATTTGATVVDAGLGFGATSFASSSASGGGADLLSLDVLASPSAPTVGPLICRSEKSHARISSSSTESSSFSCSFLLSKRSILSKSDHVGGS